MSTPSLELSSSRESQLSELVPASLTRSPIKRPAWRFIPTVLLGGVTGGALPLWSLAKTFSRQVAHEQQQFERLAELLALQTGGGEAAFIDKVAGSMRAGRWVPRGLAAIGLAAFVVTIFTRLDQGQSAVLTSLLRPPRFDDVVALIHLISITLGYLIFRWQVSQQAARLRAVGHAVDVVCDRYGIEKISKPRYGWGVDPMWLLTGGVIAAAGMLWALPMMLAVGGHRRYTKHVSKPYRKRLADTLTTLRGGPIPAKKSAKKSRRCADEHCGAEIAAGANFCGRCGQKLS